MVSVTACAATEVSLFCLQALASTRHYEVFYVSETSISVAVVLLSVASILMIFAVGVCHFIQSLNGKLGTLLMARC